MMLTTPIFSSIVVDSLGNIYFKDSEWFLGDFLSGEVIGDNILNHLDDVFVALAKIFDELVKDHPSELFPLLNGLSFLDCRV